MINNILISTTVKNFFREMQIDHHLQLINLQVIILKLCSNQFWLIGQVYNIIMVFIFWNGMIETNHAKNEVQFDQKVLKLDLVHWATNFRTFKTNSQKMSKKRVKNNDERKLLLSISQEADSRMLHEMWNESFWSNLETASCN